MVIGQTSRQMNIGRQSDSKVISKIVFPYMIEVGHQDLVFLQTLRISLYLQISAFFLFSNFRKRQIALYSPCRLVGWLVGLRHHLFFSIYRGIKALFQPSTT